MFRRSDEADLQALITQVLRWDRCTGLVASKLSSVSIMSKQQPPMTYRNPSYVVFFRALQTVLSTRTTGFATLPVCRCGVATDTETSNPCNGFRNATIAWRKTVAFCSRFWRRRRRWSRTTTITCSGKTARLPMSTSTAATRYPRVTASAKGKMLNPDGVYKIQTSSSNVDSSACRLCFSFLPWQIKWKCHPRQFFKYKRGIRETEI